MFLENLKCNYGVVYKYVDIEYLENSSLVCRDSIKGIEEMMAIVGRNLNLDMLRTSSFIVYYDKNRNILYELKNRLDSPIENKPYDILNHFKTNSCFIIKKSLMNEIDYRSLKRELLFENDEADLNIFLTN